MEPGEVKGLHGTLPHANLTQHLHTLYPTPKTNPSTSYLNMQPTSESEGLQNDLHHPNLDQYLDHLSTFNTDRFLLINSQIHPPPHEIFPSPSNNSISDEAREHEQSINHERKLRRLISNRESARRSRMRKRKQLEELQSQVLHLQTVNHKLTEKFIHLLECNHQILQENVQLKEEVSLFQKIMPVEVQTPLRDLEDVTCNTIHLRAEASNQFISNSTE